jgi:branched-chain amino acid transport system ATP-binding protein
MENHPVLEVRQLSKRFGAVIAAAEINVAVDEGEIVGLIGTNGAGKTTFLNIITGYLKPDSGSIRVLGRDIAGLPPREIIDFGVARSFQVPQIFPSHTALEHVVLAGALAEKRERSLFGRLTTSSRIAAAKAILKRFGLADTADFTVNKLPQGQRKLLDIAMAMALRPRLLLLDEPTSGVSTDEKQPLMDIIVASIRQSGVTVLFVEHDMEIVERYVTRLLAFREGRIIADGLPAEVMNDPAVADAVTGHANRGIGSLAPMAAASRPG